MRNIKLVLEYDGTDFCGWQWQPKDRSVQGTLQAALKMLFQKDVKVAAAGRTDAGVHALGQVANFRIESELDVTSIRLALNSFLPPDVVVIEAEDVDAGFHARYDAIKRTYKYVIAKRPRAVGRRYSWYCKYGLNLEAIQEASGYLIGEHAFTAFCKTTPEETHYLCNIETMAWEETDETVVFRVTANRFLHHMVRILVGTFVEVGRGKIKPATVKTILDARERGRAGAVAPAKGLFLEKVYYP